MSNEIELKRTIVLPIAKIVSNQKLLKEVVKTYRVMVKYALEIAIKYNTKSQGKLHSLCYYSLKQEFKLPFSDNELHNKLYASAIKEAQAMYNSYRKLLKAWKKGKTPKKPSPPEVSNNFSHIHLYECQYKLEYINNEYAFVVVSLSPKQKAYFLVKLYPFALEMLKKGKRGQAKIIFKKKERKCFFNITITTKGGGFYEPKADIVVDFNNDTIDISIKSDKRICFLRFHTNIGKIRWIYKRIQKFIDDKIREKNNKWRKLRRKYGNRERNRIRDMLRKVEVALIRFAKQVKGRIIIENIKWMNQQVGKKTKKKEKNKRNKLAKFPKRFLEFLEDKAKEYGVPIEKVNPKNTSITCPICGKKSKKNRVGVYEFSCINCGFEFDAQFVACMNLLSRFYKPYDPAWERANDKLVFKLGGGLVVTADARDEAMIINIDDLLRGKPVWISIISKNIGNMKHGQPLKTVNPNIYWTFNLIETAV